MGPEIAIVTLLVVAICAATFLTGLSLLIKHRQKMAGASTDTSRLRDTVALLTETLEQQHTRQQAILRRLDALEADREALPLALPADEAAPAPVRVRTRA